MSTGCIWINGPERDVDGNPILDPSGNEIYNNAIEVFEDFEDPITHELIWKRVVVIDPEIAADPFTLEPIAGIKLYKAGTDKYTIVSARGMISNGDGYTCGSIVGYTVKSVGIFLTQYITDDAGTLVVGAYFRGLNAGTAKTYSFYADGDSFTRGRTISQGFVISADNKTSPENVASQNLSDDYNLFINDLSTQNQVYYLPDPASYEPYEEIEIVNEKGYSITILPLAGDYINAYTTKKIVLESVFGCTKLRSDGVSKWFIVGLSGSFVDV